MASPSDNAWHEQIDADWHDAIWPEIQGANMEDDPLYRILALKGALQRAIRYYDAHAEAIRNERGE